MFRRKRFEDGKKSDPTVKTFGYTKSLPQIKIIKESTDQISPTDANKLLFY